MKKENYIYVTYKKEPNEVQRKRFISPGQASNNSNDRYPIIFYCLLKYTISLFYFIFL